MVSQQKTFSPKFIWVVVGLLVLGGTVYGGIWFWSERDLWGVCSADARLCPDGSAVGRTGPNCEFTACPKENNTACIQVITRARNTQTGEIKDFPTPCDVPQGWQKM